MVGPIVGVALRCVPGGFPIENPGFGLFTILWTMVEPRLCGVGAMQYLFEHIQLAFVIKIKFLQSEIFRYFVGRSCKPGFP